MIPHQTLHLFREYNLLDLELLAFGYFQFFPQQLVLEQGLPFRITLLKD
jgi:hypothetical protein